MGALNLLPVFLGMLYQTLLGFEIENEISKFHPKLKGPGAYYYWGSVAGPETVVMGWGSPFSFLRWEGVVVVRGSGNRLYGMGVTDWGSAQNWWGETGVAQEMPRLPGGRLTERLAGAAGECEGGNELEWMAFWARRSGF